MTQATQTQPTGADVQAVDARKTAERYITLWNETDATRRRALLESSWTPDARYVDPLAQVQGHAAISELVGGVQQRFPGWRFRLLGNPDAHGSHLRFTWGLGPSEAEDLIVGTDFAELAEGRLRSVTGFLDKVPAGA